MSKWTDIEIMTLAMNGSTHTPIKLMKLLPNRTWNGIAKKWQHITLAYNNAWFVGDTKSIRQMKRIRQLLIRFGFSVSHKEFSWRKGAPKSKFGSWNRARRNSAPKSLCGSLKIYQPETKEDIRDYLTGRGWNVLAGGKFDHPDFPELEISFITPRLMERLGCGNTRLALHTKGLDYNLKFVDGFSHADNRSVIEIVLVTSKVKVSR